VKRNRLGVKGFAAWCGAAALLATLAVAPAAPAKRGDVRVQGTCSGSSSSKLKLSEEGGRIEVEFEVDQNRNGVEWTVSLRHNGTRVFRGTRTTKPPSGSFELRRVIANASGDDNVRARAVTGSGERCIASATFRR
jgi:hypothetical protein